MIDLVSPSPIDLGIMAPVLGPWFSHDTLQLGPADKHLGVSLSITDQRWLPPAAGMLSFFVTRPAANRPYGLAHMRRPNGRPAFHAEDDRLIALFRLAPEVETALEQMMRFIPSATQAPTDPPAAGAPIPTDATRPRVRYFALEMDLGTSGTEIIDNLAGTGTPSAGGLVDPPLPGYVTNGLTVSQQRVARAHYLGLKLEESTLENAARPIADRKIPGISGPTTAADAVTPDNYPSLLKFSDLPPTTVTLYTFDHIGQPIDPGAVAAWWAYLANEVYNNLWAAGAPRRTVRVAGNDRLIYLTDLHGNPLADEHPLISRLSVSNAATVPGVDDEETPLRRNTAVDGSGLPVRLSFTPAPSTDDPDGAPFPRMGVLPTGRLGSAVELWPGWGSFSDITRDFMRVTLVDMENHLLGQSRVANSGDNDIIKRRAANQARESTRVNIAQTTGPVFQATIDEAAAALLEVFDGPQATQFVAQGLDRDFGPWGDLPDPELPDIPVPSSLPDFSGTIPAGSQPLQTANSRTVGAVHPLVGGGSANEEDVLVELAFDAALAGMWVRLWEGRFDVERAERRRGDGGGGRVAGAGRCFIALKLPQRTALASAPMGLDLMMKTSQGRWFEMDLRFQAPDAAAGDALDFAAASGDLFVCEEGRQGTNSTLSNIPPGAHLVALADTSRPFPVSIHPDTITAAALRESTLARKITAGDRFILTAPAFTATPDGRARAPFAADIPLDRLSRLGMSRPTDTIDIDGTNIDIPAPGSPLPGMERLEYAAVNFAGDAAQAALGSAPTLGRYHESFPHQDGHPHMPAAREHHGTGVKLNGPAALLVAEHLRDRRHRLTFDLLEDAWNNLLPEIDPAAGAGPDHWSALLKTAARGVEGETTPIVSTPLLSKLAKLLIDGDITRNAEEWVRNGIPTGSGSGVPSDLLPFVNALNTLLSTLRASAPDNFDQRVRSTARALDRRLQGIIGPHEGLTSLFAAVKRARTFIYIETPAFDSNQVGEEESALNLFQAVRTRLESHRGLKLLLCIPQAYGEGTPTPMQRVRDQALRAELEKLLGVTYSGRRVAFFSPNAGPGRSLLLASTTVIIDDVYALTGTTHLWRRGLSYDQSLATAVLGETLRFGSAATIRELRINLIRNRLGLGADESLEEIEDIMTAVQFLRQRDGGRRLITQALTQNELEPGDPPPDPLPPEQAWNMDGPGGGGFDLADTIISLTQLRDFVHDET